MEICQRIAEPVSNWARGGGDTVCLSLTARLSGEITFLVMKLALE